MSLENALVSGYSPERIPEADYACPRCDYGLNPDDRVYEWDTGNEQIWVCGDCFKNAVFTLLDWERAEMSGDSIKGTENQLMMVDYNPSDMADILGVETATAEDVL